MHLICAQCRRPLTVECRQGTEADYVASPGDALPTVESKVIAALPGPLFAVNPADILPDTLVSAGKDNGCCGSDGCDGPNRACRCGALLATERSDCWTPAELCFNAEAVAIG